MIGESVRRHNVTHPKLRQRFLSLTRVGSVELFRDGMPVLLDKPV